MSTSKKLSELIPTEDKPLPPDFPMEVSDYATASVRVAAKIPDSVANLLEDLRDAHGRDITVKSGQAVPAGQPKYKVVTFPTEEHAKEFKKHALSYSKAVMVPDGFSVRLANVSSTQVRVGVGTLVSKPRRKRTPETNLVDPLEIPFETSLKEN